MKYRIESKPEALAGGNSILKNEEEFLRDIYVAKPKTRSNS